MLLIPGLKLVPAIYQWRIRARIYKRYGELMALERDMLAQLTPERYREISRAHRLEPTSPFGNRNCAWTPPAYANRHIFARNDEEILCASLASQ